MSTYEVGTATGAVTLAAVGLAPLTVVGVIAGAAVLGAQVLSSAVIAQLACPEPLTAAERAVRTEITRVARAGERRDAMERLQERLALVTEAPAIAELVSVAADRPVERAQALLARARTEGAFGRLVERDRLALDGDRILRRGLTRAAGRVAVAERQVVAQASENAFRRSGYTIERADGPSATGLVATRHDAVVAVRVEDGGRLTTDVVSAGGPACAPVMREFGDALRAEGVTVTRLRHVPHGAARGGPLIAQALAASPDGRLVTGLVAEPVQGERRPNRQASRQVAAVRGRAS